MLDFGPRPIGVLFGRGRHLNAVYVCMWETAPLPIPLLGGTLGRALVRLLQMHMTPLLLFLHLHSSLTLLGECVEIAKVKINDWNVDSPPLNRRGGLLLNV